MKRKLIKRVLIATLTGMVTYGCVTKDQFNQAQADNDKQLKDLATKIDAVLENMNMDPDQVLNASYKETDAIDKKVAELLSKMTVEEKVGQMTQVNLNTVLVNGYGNTDGSVDPTALATAVNKYKVGSILNAIGHAYTVEQWHKILTQIQDAAKKTPNSIPVLYGIDAIHGVTFTQNSTLFPHNIGIAATRNLDLVKQSAKVTALETRASGIRWNFDPVLDIGRQPLWPRFPETFGEDPTIVREMGSTVCGAYEEDGLDKTTAVAGCMKHFVGYSNPRTGKDRTPAYIPDIELWEYYLPQFKSAVDAGASTVMINSGTVNGMPAHANGYLLKTVLRDQFGFDGVAVSDWEDIIRLHNKHFIAKTPKEAVKIAVNAGIDMSMVPHDFSFAEYLVELVNEGEVSKERLDEACGRILKLKFRLGLMDNPYPEKEAIANFGKAEYKDVALESARESITLLKNEDNILPLPKNKKVLVAGPGANNVTSLNGCWSYTWQGSDRKQYPDWNKTILEAVKAKVGEKNVIQMAYPGFDRKKNFKTEVLTEEAKNVDYIVLCLGEDAYAESPGVINDLTLDDRQLELAEAAYATGKPVVIVLTEGRPRVISRIVPGAKGIIQAYWPGSMGADAIADVLFGDYNPNGVLPYSYPRYTGDIVMYDHKYSELVQELVPGRMTETGYNPQWKFGHGLSYTTFEYSDITLSSKELKGSGTIKVSITVKNTGARDGKVAVDMYTRDMFASIAPSMRRLRAFDKISLKAGESKVVSFDLTKDDLSFVNNDLKRVTEEGKFVVMISDKIAEFTYKD